MTPLYSIESTWRTYPIPQMLIEYGEIIRPARRSLLHPDITRDNLAALILRRSILRDEMVQSLQRKFPVSIKESIAIIGLFGLDFAVWALFPGVSYFAILGIIGLLWLCSRLYLPFPWDLLVQSVLATIAIALSIGLLVS